MSVYESVITKKEKSCLTFLSTAESHTTLKTAIRTMEGNMTMDRNDMNRITLTGDLSMVGLKEQYHFMERYAVGQSEALAGGREQNAPVEIDMTGVQELDACGCQLLAVFLNNLRQRGTSVCSFKLDDAHRMKIHNLGFDDEIFNGGCP
jgi:ABC-type transporter Mla MlaB component